MRDLHAIAIIKNMLFTMENTLKYREDKNDDIKIDEYMFPEALRIVVDMASSKNSENIVTSIIKEDKK